MTVLQKKFDLVWTKTTVGRDWAEQMKGDRYVPSWLTEDEVDWGVFDKKRNRFLTYDELAETPNEDLLFEPMALS